jgi:hypothetical protein
VFSDKIRVQLGCLLDEIQAREKQLSIAGRRDRHVNMGEMHGSVVIDY